MLSLLPVTKIIALIAGLYAIIVAFILWLLMWIWGSLSFGTIGIGMTGAGVLNAVLLVFVYFGWRRLWAWCPWLNRVLFPDLNGKWKMRIHWSWEDKHGEASATAHIKQDFLTLSIEADSEDSDSQSLVAKPEKDAQSGRPTLYYLFRIFPKRRNGVSRPPYDGAAILKLDHGVLTSLQGNYFTDAPSQGHYELTRISD